VNRFTLAYLSTLLLVLLGQGAFAAEPLAPSAQIDAILAQSHAKHGIEPNPPATDEVFLRRIYLDVVGRIPTAREAQRFMQSKAPEKRAALIDELLNSEGYANHFANYWADVLRVNEKANRYTRFTMPYFLRYLRKSLVDNKPYDQLVRECLTATGGPWDNPAVGYYLRDAQMPLDNMSNTIRIFLGTRIECAQCHDHPFDVWTQRDYYHLGAFSYGMTAMVGHRHVDPPFVELLKEQGLEKAEINRLKYAHRNMWERVYPLSVIQLDTLPVLPHDYQYSDGKPGDVIAPKVPFGPKPRLDANTPLASSYAEWMTSPENERFALVVANRLWKQAFGVAVIEPLDELTELSEPVIPELMDYLRAQMIASKFDMKAYLRMVFNTAAYQRAATVEEWTAGDVYYFPGPLLRRMSAEQAWDSFVTLIHEYPEAANWQEEVRLQLLLEDRERAGRAVKDDFTVLLKRARQLTELIETFKQERNQLLAQKNAAELKGDHKAARQLGIKIGERVSLHRTQIRNVALTGSLTGELPPLATALKLGLPDPGDPITINERLTPAVVAELHRQMEERNTAQLLARGVTDSSEVRSRLRFLAQIQSKYVRSVYLPQPAPGDHFLRVFGQSDREAIENSSDEASLLQALLLMNSDLMSTVLSSHSVLGQQLAQETTPTEKIDALYLATLSRRPTAEESALLLETVEHRQEKAYADLLFAILNSRQFLFVQ
jgi:hypothetical protein